MKKNRWGHTGTALVAAGFLGVLLVVIEQDLVEHLLHRSETYERWAFPFVSVAWWSLWWLGAAKLFEAREVVVHLVCAITWVVAWWWKVIPQPEAPWSMNALRFLAPLLVGLIAGLAGKKSDSHS